MGWRFHGRASVDSTNPRAFAVCDRCGFWFNHDNLQFQFDWRGSTLANLNILVCPRCTDRPFELNRPLKLPPDPEPIKNARVEPFLVDGSGGVIED